MVLGLLILLFWLLSLLFGIVKKEEIARHAAESAKRDMEALEKREQILSQNLKDLETERGREASLRETYGVALPGEEVIIVVEPEAEKPLGELPIWRKFLGFFGQ